MAEVTLARKLSIQEFVKYVHELYPKCRFLGSAGLSIVIDGNIKFDVILNGKKLEIVKRPPLFAVFFDSWMKIYKEDSIATEIINFVKKKCDQAISHEVSISNLPEICPICKSLNINKLTECEWCGSQIV